MKERVFTRLNLIVVLALLLASHAIPAATQARLAPATPDQRQVTADRPGAPLMFIEDVSQVGDGARFQVRGRERTIWLAEDAIWVTVLAPSGVNFKLSFPGGNLHPRLEPFNRLDTHVSYFVGDDPARWRPDVSVWGGVRYKELYPGLDLEVSGEGGQWAWRLVCHRADCQSALQTVRLRVEGADTLALEPIGDEGLPLRLTAAAGDFTLPLLQVVDSDGTPLALKAARPTVKGTEVMAPFSSSFSLSPQDSPEDLLYSTFLGGSEDDCPYKGCAIAADGAGNAYVVGFTCSADFPTTPGAFDGSYNPGRYCEDVFVVKMNPSGTGLIYATFLGGNEDDVGRAIAIDGAGHAYVTGDTASPDFPTTPGAFEPNYHGGYYPQDAFVVKLNPTGTGLVYSTFLAGGANDRGQSIAVDGAGNAYAAGTTQSSNFPTTSSAFDPTYNSTGGVGELDAFVVKLNAAGTGLAYATYLGGLYDDGAEGVAVDGEGNAYVTGDTYSPDFPVTPGAFDESHSGVSVAYVAPWSADAFVAKLNAAGSALAYATFLGGTDSDSGYATAVDESGSAYVAGSTRSADFPVTAGAFDTSFGGGTCGSSPCADVFVAKLNAAGSNLSYSTFLGGGDSDSIGYSMALDGEGNAYVTGGTRSADFPTTLGAFDTTFSGGLFYDVFVVKLNASGSELGYGTFLGEKSSTDFGYGIAVAETDKPYVVGHTDSAGFPTTAGAFDTSYNGEYDVFVAKLFTAHAIQKQATPDSSQAVKFGDPITYTIRLVESDTLGFYDQMPTCTSYISGSLNAPAGVAYEPSTNAISGTLNLAGSIPVTVSFAVRVEVTGTAESAPIIVNRACIHPPDGGLADCEWSNEVWNFTYVWPTYLPIVLRNQ